MRVPHPFLDLPTPLVIGHRGCAGRLPENTLASFRAALEDGAVILETDVHLTRDGEPVLIHDHDVTRVSEGDGAVRDLDLRDIEQLDAGYRFSPDGGRTHPERGRGHRIPTLRAALDAFPAARFNLELKEDLPDLVERTLRVIDAAGSASRTLLVAAEDELMRRIRARVASRGAAVALGASAGEVARFVRAAQRGEAPEPGISALQIPAAFAGRPLVTPELVAHAHQHGVQVHVWTINEPAEMQRLLDLGVDGIVSDFPARVAAVLASRHRSPDMCSAPSPFFLTHLERLRAAARSGPVVDVACGRGRHAMATAERGIPILGIDRNPEFLAALCAAARARRLPVAAVRTDLGSGRGLPLAPASCGAILVFRYLHRPLVPHLVAALKPGGLLLYETFTIHQRDLGYGPKNEHFLLHDGELRELFSALQAIDSWEGRTQQEDGPPATLARLAARKR